MSSIVLSGVTKAFDGKRVISDLNLEIPLGSKVCIMGESGSGKTTLINLIAGIIKPDSGTVSGVNKSRIGFVFQEDRLLEMLTVYRNIKLMCGGNITKQGVMRELENVGLYAGLVDSRAETLSGGMKRRVSILRALLCGSDILIMDEPTKGLDDDNKALVVNYILEKTEGKTLIWVTHDKKEAEYVSDRIIQL